MSSLANSINMPLAVAPAEAAKMLSIGKTRLYEMIGAKDIPVIKIGRRTLIRVRDIEAYLDRLAAAS
jgi:excisionase family DNA binding protein